MDIDEVNGAFTGEMGIGCDDYDDYDVAPSSPISSRQEGDVSEKEYQFYCQKKVIGKLMSS